MFKKAVVAEGAPAPIGPYSQAIVAAGFLFASGQIPLDPKTGQVVGEDITAQTERVMENLVAVLRQAGMGPENVVKTTVYLRDMAEFAQMNEVYGRYFGKDPAPARATIQAAALPRGVKVEIDLVGVF